MNGEKEQKIYTFLKVSVQPPLQGRLCMAAVGSGQAKAALGSGHTKTRLLPPCPNLGLSGISWHLSFQLQGFVYLRISSAHFTS